MLLWPLHIAQLLLLGGTLPGMIALNEALAALIYPKQSLLGVLSFRYIST